MTAQKGAAFLLKTGDGGSPPTYETVAGLRTTQMTINGDTVVVTHKESGGWRELLSGAGNSEPFRLKGKLGLNQPQLTRGAKRYRYQKAHHAIGWSRIQHGIIMKVVLVVY